MLRTLGGLLLLILFYSGAYQFVKERFKLSPFFIPLFIHIAIMMALYAGGLMGLMQPTAWLIGSLGIISFGIAFIKNKPALFSDFKQGASRASGAYRALFHRNTTLSAILLYLINALSAFALMNISINIWAHDRMPMLLIWAILTCLAFPLMHTLLSQAFNLIRRDRGYRIISILFFMLSCALFLLLLSSNEFLLPRTDRITITNLGPAAGTAGQGEITFLELKAKRGGEKLEPALASQKDIGRLLDASGQIVLKGNDDQLLSSLDGRGPNTYEFLFLRTPASGLVEIDINGKASIYDLSSESVSQKRVVLNSRFQPGDWIILLAHFALMVALLQMLARFLHLYHAKESDSLFSRYADSILILCFIGALFLFTRTMQFYEWDEFSHWGIFIKELAIKNKLPTEDFCTAYPSYIPGITLFEYFFTSLLGFTEGHAYFAYLFFVLSEIGVMLVHTSRQALLSRLLYFFVMIIALFLLPLYFISLYVDVPLGLLFGAGLIFYRQYRNTPKVNAGLLMIFCGLQLMKMWGLVFSLILFGIVSTDQIFHWIQKIDERRNEIRKWVFLVIILAGSILLVQLPWRVHIQENGIAGKMQFETEPSQPLVEIIERPELDAGALFRDLVHTTMKGRQETNLAGLFSVFNLSLMLLLIAIMTSYQDGRELIFNISIAIFFFINIAIIFLAYISYFPVEGSIRLASFERYVSEFFAGWILFIIYQTSSRFMRGYCPRRISITAHAVLVIFVFLSLPSITQVRLPPRSDIGRREELKEIIIRYENLLFNGDIHQIFHIAQNTNGLTHHALRYELCPNISQIDGWSFGEPYTGEEIECETLPYSVDELQSSMTADYDFVLVSKPDSQLWNKYGDLFNNHRPEGDQLFKVVEGELNLVD